MIFCLYVYENILYFCKEKKRKERARSLLIMNVYFLLYYVDEIYSTN